MPAHPTYEKLQALKLDGMAAAFAEMRDQDAAADLCREEWLGILVDSEEAHRQNRRFNTLIRTSKLKYPHACPEDADFRAKRGLDKRLFRSLAGADWVKRKQNLIVTGPCGVGKTWLSCALGVAVCRTGAQVVYRRMFKFLDELDRARGDGTYPKLMRAVCKAKLLILDDWGPERLSPNQRRDLFEIVDERCDSGATMVTSQLPVSAWHEVIGEPTLADGILDRIVTNAHRLELKGESMRKSSIGNAKDKEVPK